MESDHHEHIYYAIETFVIIGGFHSHHTDFETDTIVVLAEVNKNKGTVECCDIWPGIMDEPELRWELSNMIHHSIDSKSCFTTESGISASIEYNNQINKIMSKRKNEFL